MKTSKYLICNDILAKENQPAEFILHNQYPRFLAKVELLDFEEIEKRPVNPFADVLYINSVGEMDIYRLEAYEFMDKVDDEDILDELFPAREFYIQYLQQMELEEGSKSGFPVKDFSSDLPGLKILQGHGSWTIVYNGIIAEFDSEDNMNEFLEHDLAIESDLLDKGIINQFD